MIKAVHEAGAGINDAFNRLERASRRIAREEAAADPASNVVDILKARRAGGASLSALRTADAMIGSLLDVLA